MKKAKLEIGSESLRAELSELVERLLPAARQPVADCAAKRARALLEGSDDDVYAVDEAGYVARLEVERLELRADNLTKEIEKVEAAETLAMKQQVITHARREAERLAGIRQRRVEIALEDRELARDDEAITLLVREANEIARKINAPKIALPPIEPATIQRFELPADQRAVAERLKALRKAAAA